jgi:hypothetical protein
MTLAQDAAEVGPRASWANAHDLSAPTHAPGDQPGSQRFPCPDSSTPTGAWTPRFSSPESTCFPRLNEPRGRTWHLHRVAIGLGRLHTLRPARPGEKTSPFGFVLSPAAAWRSTRFVAYSSDRTTATKGGSVSHRALGRAGAPPGRRRGGQLHSTAPRVTVAGRRDPHLWC